MNKGYLPISRKLFEHELWCEKREFSRAEAWIELLRSVRFEVNTASVLIGDQSVEIHRGEIPASLRYLASRWGWSKNKVSNFLNYLEKSGMIKRRTAEGTQQTIISICNYEYYNVLAATTRPQKGHQRDTERTNNNKENKGKIGFNNKSYDLSFVDKAFEDVFHDWIEYKSSRNERYKSQKSLEILYQKIIMLSDGKPQNARQIVNESIANNWAGLFPLKNKNNGSTTGATAKKAIPTDTDGYQSTL